MKRPVEFQINEVYRQEVVRLLSARKRSHVIHASGDIDASGDEMEEAFREMLRRRLPKQYFVGHGHIVDKSLNVSPQFDVIIADNNATPILFEAENGCQYFPWESVYAIGEIKSSYVKRKHHISAFAENIKALTSNLEREPTPRNYIGNGVTLAKPLTTSETRAYRNPLFTFIVFFDSGDVSQSSLSREYCINTDDILPVVAVFLDGKLVVKAELLPAEGKAKMGDIHIDPFEIVSRPDIHWMLVTQQNECDRGAQALIVLMLALFNHLNRSVLMPPSIEEYLGSVLQAAPNRPHVLSIRALMQSAKLAGVVVPKRIEDFLQFKVSEGTSPFDPIRTDEFDRYLRKTGISAQTFFKDAAITWRKNGRAKRKRAKRR